MRSSVPLLPLSTGLNRPHSCERLQRQSCSRYSNLLWHEHIRGYTGVDAFGGWNSGFKERKGGGGHWEKHKQCSQSRVRERERSQSDRKLESGSLCRKLQQEMRWGERNFNWIQDVVLKQRTTRLSLSGRDCMCVCDTVRMERRTETSTRTIYHTTVNAHFL